MTKKLKLLLVDFDGVMSNGRFYATDDPNDQTLSGLAVRHIFNTENAALLDDWMRGTRSFRGMHELIQSKTGVSADQLDDLLLRSVKLMPLNKPLLAFTQELRKAGVVVSLFTNNMDIFDNVSRWHHKLDDFFDHIYSSSAYGQLKLENDELIKTACLDAGTNQTHTALVDDSMSSFKAATAHGIQPFLYENYVESQKAFENWIKDNFSI
jgi:FMN phosphatase YigB (HAD superfamily)